MLERVRCDAGAVTESQGPRRVIARGLFVSGYMMSLHFDPRVTWSHIATTVGALIAVGVMWQQVTSVVTAVNMLTAAIESNNGRIARIESRTAVLEAQRLEAERRLTEIHDDVKWLRTRFERAPQ